MHGYSETQLTRIESGQPEGVGGELNQDPFAVRPSGFFERVYGQNITRGINHHDASVLFSGI